MTRPCFILPLDARAARKRRLQLLVSKSYQTRNYNLPGAPPPAIRPLLSVGVITCGRFMPRTERTLEPVEDPGYWTITPATSRCHGSAPPGAGNAELIG